MHGDIYMFIKRKGQTVVLKQVHVLEIKNHAQIQEIPSGGRGGGVGGGLTTLSFCSQQLISQRSVCRDHL